MPRLMRDWIDFRSSLDREDRPSYDELEADWRMRRGSQILGVNLTAGRKLSVSYLESDDPEWEEVRLRWLQFEEEWEVDGISGFESWGSVGSSNQWGHLFRVYPQDGDSGPASRG